MAKANSTALLVAAIFLAACASMPTGPDVAVMPGPGKSFEQFQMDDHVCRDHAERSLQANPNQVGAANVAQGAAVGTVAGAAAGALLGEGRGGAVAGGAGMGLLLGSAIGMGNAGQAEQAAQRKYDIAYEQCMSAKGNRIPTPPVSYYPYRHNPPQRVIIYQQAPGEPPVPPPPPPP
jgi:uncharacterized protein YcfJ